MLWGCSLCCWASKLRGPEGGPNVEGILKGGGVKIWTQNKEGCNHQHKDSKKSCKIFQG